jgi:hypothetical protein
LFEHKEKIGAAIWEFLWCISRTTKEEMDTDGVTWGLVFGGKPVKHAEISTELGTSIRSVKRNMARLKEMNYIDTTRVRYGEIIRVRRSKKWRGARSDLSEDQRRVKNGTSKTENGADMAHLVDKSGTSNKILYSDITKKDDIYDLPYERDDNQEEGVDGGVPSTGGSVPQEIPSDPSVRIENHLADKMGQLMIPYGDIVKIKKLLDGGIPEKDIIAGIDIAFSNFRPKFSRDRIRSITYCEPLIWNIYTRSKNQAVRKEGENYSIHGGSMQGSSKKTESPYKRKWDDFEFGNEEE